MGKVITELDPDHREWIAKQKVFFVASAPLSGAGHINCSPRGGDSLRILNSSELVFHDLTGSGAETAAHVRENGRILIMLCAFAGPPRIMRFHGQAELILPQHERFAHYAALFPEHLATRAFFHVAIERMSTSCGYGVPLMDFVEDRSVLDKWAEKKGREGAQAYRLEKNRLSIDGLPAFDPPVEN